MASNFLSSRGVSYPGSSETPDASGSDHATDADYTENNGEGFDIFLYPEYNAENSFEYT